MSVRDLMVLRGRVASEVVIHRGEEPGARAFARFRMAVPRVRRRDDGEWEESEPNWYSVKAWGALAEHAHLSAHRGQPIVVVGRPSAQGWISKEGEVRTEIAVHAVTIGHDLVFGVASFSRLQRQPSDLTVKEEQAGSAGTESPDVVEVNDEDLSVQDLAAEGDEDIAA